MDSTILSSHLLTLCKWCGISNSEADFENVRLCHICHQKALLAVQNPRLCDICNGLATKKNVFQALFSEHGYSHMAMRQLERSAENGCGLCRLLLLQDPNPDWGRFVQPLSLFAERENGLKKQSDGEINTLYFSSEAEIFKLKLSVSADAGNNSSTSQILRSKLIFHR